MVYSSAQRALESRELSIVVPCYNEEESLVPTAVELIRAFQGAAVDLELVLVDNGSRDRTSALIDGLAAQGLPVVKATVAVNQGFGFGLLTGIAGCHGRFIGWVCADGQVAAEDVLEVYQRLRAADRPALAKARRRYRKDSWIRKPVSLIYNAMMLVLFPGMPCLDVNGNPKVVPADILHVMDLQSHDWFFEAEVMLKAQHLRLPVVEIDVFGRARRASRSHVRTTTILEFLRNIVAYRMGGPWRGWKKRTARLPAQPAAAHSTLLHG